MRRTTLKKTTLLVLAIAVLSACDSAGLDEFVPEVSVSAVLIANEPLPRIRLALTGPTNEPYDEIERSINDAQVLLQWIQDNGTTVDLPYELVGNAIGVYKYVNSQDSVLVEGGGTYRFEATVPGFTEPVTAETIVPDAFSVAAPPPDTMYYQVGASPRLDITPTTYPGRQNIYVFNVRAMDPENFPLTPFAADLVRDRDVDPVDLYEGNSPLLNESNYEVNPDGTVRISIIWLAFNFYGPQRFLITAVDDALVNFIQSQTIQFLPTTLSPGEIPNVVSNVENGVGVFGSVAQATTTSFLAQAP